MSIIETRNISKSFPGVLALNNVSVTIEQGRIHCIIGENGAGKSTLIKILTGIYQPDYGDVLIDGKSALVDRYLFDAVAYVPQELDQFDYMTVADNLFMCYEKSGFNNFFIYNRDLFKKAIPWLKKFQISASPDQLIRDLSISERQLLQIARAMVNEKSKILVLDEPTTSLTIHDTQRLFDVIYQIKDTGKAIIFISHKLDEIFTLADDITVMRNGEKVAEEKAYNVDIPWAVNQMVGKEMDKTVSYAAENCSSDVLFEASHITGDKFFDVSFCLHRGEILGFTGLIGSGRSEIMQAILGYLPVWDGSATLDGEKWKFHNPNFAVHQGFIYLSEERKKHGIFPSMRLKENATISLLEKLSNMFGISRDSENSIAKKIVDAYDIKAVSLEQEIKYLSGGNQQKTIIGRSMFTKPKVLVFDEPTKGIDVGTKTEIYKLMNKLAEKEGVGIILISSEMDEVIRCSNRIIAMYKGRIVSEFNCTEIQSNRKGVMNAILGNA